MNVNKTAADMVRTDALQRAQGSASPQAPVDAVAPTRGSDAVQISDAGLALSAGGETQQSSSTLDSSRIDQIRSNILSGAYNSLESADKVARAVIRSSDL
jgi:anti-sigma28 factor (negative regulator of flagellin synthesis)